jgi:rhodanese-related sulfurtransferase
MRELTSDECNNYLQRATDKPLLLDVREPWEYRIVHLESSRLVPMRQIPQVEGTLDPNQEIIVICHHGIRSRQVALYLENKGFTDVVNLRGGVDAWARHTDMSMPTY